MHNKEINLEDAHRFASHLALEGGKILRDSFAETVSISVDKGSIDFSTDTDMKVDTFLQERINDKYPNTLILSEETAPECYSEYQDADYVWINDPLDGTSNFFHGFPRFGISIGLVKLGEPLLGVIYLPMTDELFSAQADRDGAILNGKPIHSSFIDNLKRSSFLCDWCPNEAKRQQMIGYLKGVLGEVWQIKSQGSAVADLCCVAAGQSEAYLNAGLKPWDVAAASLIVKKAGGRITTPEGDKYSIFNPDIFASNTILHDPILNLINQ